MRQEFREAARRLFPAWAAERAMRYERGVRERRGVPAAAREVSTHFGRNVLGGPFAGMKLVEGFESFAASPVLKLLGQYEPVFHTAVERAIEAEPALVVNVGCADGYYAVGLALRLPGASVVAYDIARTAREETAALACTNGVADRVTVRGRCRQFPEDVALVLCDVDGGEDRLLTPRQLRRTVVLVETHDVLCPGVTDRLRSRFSATHDVEILSQMEPDGSRLDWMSGGQRAAAVDEMRYYAQTWLAMWPHANHPRE